MSLPIGRFIINSNIAETVSFSRAVDGAVNSYSDIATFQTTSGQHVLFMAIKDTATGIYKQYSFAVAPNHTGGLWFKVNPLEDVGTLLEDVNAEVRSNGLTVELRLRKSKGVEGLSFNITLQNLGIEDAGLVLLSSSGVDTAASAGEISAIPYGSSSTDHNQLANRGVYTHAQIDTHINSSSPHTGHEKTSNKNTANGYAGLNSTGHLIFSQIPVGTTPGTVCAGDDVRLQGGLPPGAHATTHSSGGADELNLGNLPGVLPQAKTHESVDTDVSIASIHHTLGTGANQAAAGNHAHPEYAPFDQGVEGGSTHSHDGVDTAKIPHTNLDGAGSYNHSEIDSHIDSDSPHSGHESISNKNAANGYAGLGIDGKLLPNAYTFGSSAGTVCEGNDPRLTGERPPLAHADTHREGGADELSLPLLSGTLPQSKTHDVSDTDVTESSLHHTLGTGPTQAAAGNHAHSNYAPIEKGVTGGDNHTHSIGDGAQLNHSDLSNIGVTSHENIDIHIAASAPHSEHEKLLNKNISGGYVGISASGKIDGAFQLYGNTSNTACEGNDPRLSDPRIPIEHNLTHQEGGVDELSLFLLQGNLNQDRSHDNQDTDLAAESLHHTIGTGPFQAAAGNHTHTDEYDTRYSPLANGVTGGDTHDHSGGDGAQIDHASLYNIGSNTHSQIDVHIDAGAPHSGHEQTANKGIPNGYAALDAGSYLLPVNIPFGNSADSVCRGNDTRLSDSRNPLLHSNSHISGASDELSLADLEGNLDQDRAHDNADTDQYENALHHTLGNGGMQAAAGDHIHDGNNGLILEHSVLNNSGVNTHAQIDTHIANTSLHFVVDDVLPSSVNTYSSNKIGSIANTKEDKVNKGVAGGYAGLDSNGYVPAAQMSPLYKEIRVVNNIADRDLLDVYEGLRAHVKDASSDPTVDSGWAEYLHDGTSWSKTAEQESIDVVLDWANIENRPTSTIVEIDQATALRHSQNTDTYLEVGSANQVSAVELRSHIDAANPHVGHEVLSAKDAANGYAGLDASGKIISAKLYVGSASGTVCAGDDVRLSDARTPVAHVLATNTGLGAYQTISGASAGQVLRASSATEANFQQLSHGDLSSIGSYTHDQIDAHVNAAAPHAGHALTVHQHGGGDITSAVAEAVNADTVDGLHAASFSLTTHNHSLDDLSNVSISGNTAGEVLKWSGTAWVNNTLAEAGIEPAFIKNTAFNKNFGSSAGTVSEGNHVHTKAQITDFAHTHAGSDITSSVANATNADTLDGYHASSFSLTTHNHTLDSLSNTSITSVVAGEVLKWDGSAWINNTLAEAGIEPAFSKNTAFNKNFGTASGTVCQGNDARLSDARIPTAHTHSGGDITSAVANATNATNAAYATSAGNADTVDGYHVSTFASAANTVPVRDASGHLNLGWINTTSGEFTGAPARIYSSDDAYIRYMTPANFFNNCATNVITAIKTVDGSGSGLDADLLDGYHGSSSATASTYALRDGSGDILARLFRSNYGEQTHAPATTVNIAFRNSTADDYIRFMTNSAFSAWCQNSQVWTYGALKIRTSAPASPTDGDIWMV